MRLRGRRQRHLHDGLRRRVDTHNHRLAHLGGKLVADGPDRVSDLVSRLGQVLLEIKNELEVGIAFIGRGAHLLDTRDSQQGFFDPIQHFALDRLGRRTRKRNIDHEHGQIDVRVLIDLEFLERHQTRRHQGNQDDDRRNRAPDTELG